MGAFNERLRQARMDKGYTQIQLSKIVGISKDLYNKYERTSTCPNYETLLKFSNVLGVSADYLLGNDKAEEELDIEALRGLIARNFKNLPSEQKLALIKELTD